MTLINPNGLKGSYQHYQLRQLKSLCNQIPEERKEELLGEIKARAFLLGANNQTALNNTIKHLTEKRKETEPKSTEGGSTNK